MRDLVWSNTFRRALRRTLKRQPQVLGDVAKTLELLQENLFDTQLATHKLKGRLAGTWACSAGYDLRILFELIPNPDRPEEDIFLLEIGTHDEVY